MTDLDLDELERLTRDYAEALAMNRNGWVGAPSLLAAGAPLVQALDRHGGEHAVLLDLIAAARKVEAGKAACRYILEQCAMATERGEYEHGSTLAAEAILDALSTPPAQAGTDEAFDLQPAFNRTRS